MTNVDGSIDSSNFFVQVYLPLIRTNSVTNMHGRATFVKESFLFAGDLSLKNSRDCILRFRLVLLYLI